MRVIYLDNHLFAACKPAGMVTQGAFDILAKQWLKSELNKPGAVFLEPVHRIDKCTGGLVLFARTSKALSRLHAMMRAHEIQKTYLACVEKCPPEQEGTLEHYLVHDRLRARVVSPSQRGAKRALLSYRVLLRPHLLEILLHTGRYHQIRAQLAAIGCPVCGDTAYGGQARAGGSIALFAAQMALTHPVTHEELVLTA